MIPPMTLIDHLRARARDLPQALYSRYLFADRAPVETRFAALERRTRAFAGAYRGAQVGKGDVVLVILDHHEDLMPAFLGAIWLKSPSPITFGDLKSKKVGVDQIPVVRVQGGSIDVDNEVEVEVKKTVEVEGTVSIRR